MDDLIRSKRVFVWLFSYGAAPDPTAMGHFCSMGPGALQAIDPLYYIRGRKGSGSRALVVKDQLEKTNGLDANAQMHRNDCSRFRSQGSF